jgi:hypothetical protein
MSSIDPNARKDVNDAIINAGSAAVGQMIDTANSSLKSVARTEMSELDVRVKKKLRRIRRMLLFVLLPEASALSFP